MSVYRIYKLTAPDGRCYIGQTKRPLEERWNHGRNYEECPRINDAILTYGWDAFTKEVLEECQDEASATQREQYWIDYFNATNPEFGLNLSSGGKTGYSHAVESKQKMSAARMGFKQSDETKQRLREIALSRPPASEETRRKISQANTGHWVGPEEREKRSKARVGFTMSDEAKAKIRNNPNCNGNRVKKVRCIETGEIFPSARAASAHIGKQKGAVTSSIYSGTACCGYHFEYLTKGLEEVMPISDSKERISIILPKSLKETLRKIADEENRSLSNLIITILQEYLSKR